MKMAFYPTRVFVILILVIYLFQCQSARLIDKQNPPATWPEHQERMRHLEQWDLGGKIGITYPYEGKRKAVTARFDWQQQQDNFVMVLAGPMGVGRFTLEKNAKITLVTNPHGEQFRGRSPEDLFHKHAGMHLPLTDLAWWIRGIPAPDKTHQKTFHAENFLNQLATLEQSAWRIEYANYQLLDGNFLPQKIKLSDGAVNVTLIINDWHIQPVKTKAKL
jgi:outer membrane lipoprotein LolB